MRYGDDNYQLLVDSHAKLTGGELGALPRRTLYGSAEAMGAGLAPIHDFPDLIVTEAEIKAVIAECHAKKRFPMYHQEASGVLKSGWFQSRYNLCWSYGLSAATMDCQAAEGQTPIRLAPFSLAWLVGYRNAGYYLDKAIAGACERGIASAEYVPEYELNPKKFKAGWEQDALRNRPTEFFDTRRADGEKSMIRQCLSILRIGRPGYIAYDWWGHALECVGMLWDESVRNCIVWLLRNSHGEQDLIQLTGSRGVPDEFYGVRATARRLAA